MKNKVITLVKLLSVLVLFTSCEFMMDKKLKSSKLELRQLVQETENKKTAYATYFLIFGSYKQNEEKLETVKVFAKVENRYRLIEIPLDKIRIAIDNKLTTPNIEIEYTHNRKYKDEELVDKNWLRKIYVINCPEQYLPQNLLPIEL